MHHPYTQSINLNVNLINFPSPIQLSMNHKMTKSTVQQPKSKNIKNHSLTINKKQSPLFYQNLEDSMQEFHPTMSTESLCKVKKMYEKSMKTKGFGKSLDDFLNADVENIVRKNTNVTSSRQLDQKGNIQKKHISNQNTSKSNQYSNHSSNVSSRNSTQHLVSKQPIEEIQCYDTFQEDEDFVKFDLLNKNIKDLKQKQTYGKDVFKKNKNKGYSEKCSNPKKSTINEVEIVSKNQNEFKTFNRSRQLKVSLHQQQNRQNLNNISRSKSKSRSKSRQKSRQKTKNQVLKKLPSAKNNKSIFSNDKQLVSKLSTKHNISKSPLKESCQSNAKRQRSRQKKIIKPQIQRSKSKPKSRSKSKNQKKFIRSNIQIEISNHHTFSPSPATKRGDKSKSFSRSRSKSNHKSHSKEKRSMSKSAKSQNIHLNKSKSPKRSTQKKKLVKQFNLKSSSEMMEQKASISKEMKKSRSVSKEKQKKLFVNEQKATSRQKKTNKKTCNKQQMTKQFSQQILKPSQFMKNKNKKITYAKPDTKISPDHSRSTNFYLPQRKESIKPIVKAQKQLKAKKSIKQNKNKSKHNQKSKNQLPKCIELTGNSTQQNKSQILKAVLTIQRIYRGYRVRKQLNEDLNLICDKVQHVKNKIKDKQSKYWLRGNQQKERQINMKQKGLEESRDRIKKLKGMKQMLKFNQNNRQFQSILSSSNSIQHIEKDISVNKKPNNYRAEQQYIQQKSQPMSPASVTLQQNSQSQLMYLEQMVNKDVQLNAKFLKENEQLKEHIRSISSEHLKMYENGTGARMRDDNQGQIFYSEDDEENSNAEEDQNEQTSSQHDQKDASDQQNLQEEKEQQQKPKQQKQQPASKPLLKVSQLAYISPPTFEFYEAYSPKHYIVSPKNNPSESLSRMVSPISSVSSRYNHNQIPFSLQSPQNIMNGENLSYKAQHEIENDRRKPKYFQAIKEKQEEQFQEKKVKIQQREQKLSDEIEKKIELLKKLFYEDKLLSPKTFEKKMNAFKAKHQIKDQSKIEEVKQQKNEQISQPQSNSVGKKMKITELTEKLGQKNEQTCNVSKALFSEQSPNPIYKQHHLEPQIKQLNSHEQQSFKIELNEPKVYKQDNEQPQDHRQHQQIDLPVSHRYQRCGFPTELIFIKNYIFQFFTFIKSTPHIEKQLLLNLLAVPYDNAHLLTCYRTQLHQIDAQYYEDRIQGHFLAYPYWKNLIDYEPVIGTEIFQRFSQSLQERAHRNEDIMQESQGEDKFSISEEQQMKFSYIFRDEKMSLKEIQRIFLMMLMDSFNQAFEEERCSYRETVLIKQQKGGMNKEHVVIQTLKKIDEIQKLQKSIPVYYLQPDQSQRSNMSRNSSLAQANELQGSQNYQFFTLQSLRQKKEQLIDVILCSVLKRVLQNWGRSMCGLIIEPEEEDEMQITMEQIQVKNTERLCLALNKYVEEYEKELANVMKEHELCTKLMLSDKVLEFLLVELVEEMYGEK